MTDRQRQIRERGLAKAREMSREYAITSRLRKETNIFLKASLILLTIAIIQSIYIICT